MDITLAVTLLNGQSAKNATDQLSDFFAIVTDHQNVKRRIPQDLLPQEAIFSPRITRGITIHGTAHQIHSTSKSMMQPLIHFHLLEVRPVMWQELEPTPTFLAPTQLSHPELMIHKLKLYKCRKG